VFIVSRLSHLAPKSVIFQNAWGVKFGLPYFLHIIRTIKRIFESTLSSTLSRMISLTICILLHGSTPGFKLTLIECIILQICFEKLLFTR
jgi:hypothetical protein